MNTNYQGRFTDVNGVRLHYLDYADYASAGLPMLILHSLSANAHIFHGLVSKGLAQSHRLIIPDLRGRGESSRVLSDHSLEEESQDMIALLDQLGIQKVILCGHSFGGLLAAYMAAHYPERVEKLIVLDAAIELNPLTPFLISYATGRMLTNYPSWDVYVETVRKVPFMDRWDASMLHFLRADVIENENGSVSPKNSLIDVGFAAGHIFSINSAQWRKYFCSVKQPTLLITAANPFAHGQHIVTEDKAIQTAALMMDCELQVVDGNHITMLFDKGAGEITRLISKFAVEHKSRKVAA